MSIMLVIVLLLASCWQRLLLDAILNVSINDLILTGSLTFISVLLAAATLRYLIPWPGANGPWQGYLILAATEAFGVVVMTVSLILVPTVQQSLISRGCEVLVVALTSYWLPSGFDQHLARKHVLCVAMLSAIGAILIPLVCSFVGPTSGTSSYIGLPLVVSRAVAYGIQSIAEQVLVHNYAVTPSRIVLVEAAGGMLVTLAAVTPISLLPSLQRRFKLNSFSRSGTLIFSSWYNFLIILFFVLSATLQNQSRILVVRRYSAMAYQMVGSCIPGALMLINFPAYIISKGRMGSAFTLTSWIPDMISLVCVFAATLLYFMWNKKPHALYLRGIRAQEPLIDKVKHEVDFVCKSGFMNANSSIGCYASTADDYEKLYPFFKEVAMAYHGIKSLPNDPESRTFEMPPTLPEVFSKFDWKDIAEVRFRVARSVKGFALPTSMTFTSRRKLLGLARDLIITFQASLERIVLESQWEEKPMSECKDMWPIREYECMESAGLLREWPDDRAVFTIKFKPKVLYNNHPSIIILGVIVNEEDHLRFFATTAFPCVSTAHACYELLSQLVHHVGEQTQYAISPEFGYLASCPSNIGTGFKISLRSQLGVTSASERRLGLTVGDIIADTCKAIGYDNNVKADGGPKQV